MGASVILDTIFNVNTSSIIAALGVGGIAVSLGFQDTLANLIGGLQVTFMGIVKPGDNIEVGSETGVVQDVSLLHGYHYANVAAADLPSLALGEGLSMIGLGIAVFIGVVAGGGIAAYRGARWAKVLLALCVALFVVCLIAMVALIIHYNGSLMG